MLRELICVTLVVLVLALAAEACGGGPLSSGGGPTSPNAEATNVRRTAVAAVQKIIANNYTPTPQPAATDTPTPTCQNAIWWTDARSHVGESRTVQGTIVATRAAPDGGVLLEIGQPYPDPTGLAIILPPASTSAAEGKIICAAGRITFAEGRPTLRVRDASSIVVVN